MTRQYSISTCSHVACDLTAAAAAAAMEVASQLNRREVSGLHSMNEGSTKLK
jgi:hypothetical protein